jgi:predicted RNA-binding protein YlxR (DUF448 family)
MGRGGAAKDRTAPERRCIATGRSGPTDRLIRFVLSPDGSLAPDLAERLPGRGVWLSSDRASVDLAVRKRLFSRGFRKSVDVAGDLADQLEARIVQRLVEAIGLCRKAGQAVCGFEMVRARLGQGGASAVFAASDGAEDGRRKVAGLRGDAQLIECLTAAELGLAFGRDSVIHAVLDAGGASARVLREARRLDGFRQSG